MELSQLLDVGMSLKPKALTEEQITRFYYRNRYKDNFEDIWENKLENFRRKWSKIYLYNKVVSYPKLKISWKLKEGKYHIAHKTIDDESSFPCLTVLPDDSIESLEAKVKSLCRYHYCKYEDVDFKKFNSFIFMSLEELA